jgi:hypothetical protein
MVWGASGVVAEWAAKALVGMVSLSKGVAGRVSA